MSETRAVAFPLAVVNPPPPTKLCRLCFGPEHRGPHSPDDCREVIEPRLRYFRRKVAQLEARLALVDAIVEVAP